MIRLLLFLISTGFVVWVAYKAIQGALQYSPNFRIYRMKKNLDSRRKKMDLIRREISLREEELKLLEEESKLTEQTLKS